MIWEVHMKKDNFNVIGNNIRNLRLKHNYSQDELAELLDVSTNHIYRIEAGTSNISLKVLLKAREIFSVNANALIEESQRVNDITILAEEIAGILEQCNEIETKIIIQTVHDLHKTLKQLRV